MFSTTILDVAAGVVFGFLAISLFTSAAIEAINTLLRTRARNLKSGVMALLNDKDFNGLAKQLYEHANISPLGPGPVSQQASNAVTGVSQQQTARAGSDANPAYGKWKNLPSYIDKNQFAGALLDVTKLSEAYARITAADAKGQTAINELNSTIDKIPDEQIKQLLKGIVNRTGGDIKKIETELSAWFDVGMDRVGGFFKRWTQASTFVIAFVFAGLVNVDAIRIGTVLWGQPAVAQKMKDVTIPTVAATTPTTLATKETGVAAVDQPKSPPTLIAPGQAPAAADEARKTAEDVDKIKEKDEAAIALVASLSQEGVPIGWARGHFWQVSDDHGNWGKLWPYAKPDTIGWSLLGWLITATAALFGAPFWFDTLQSIIRLKGSGPSPAEKLSGRAAAN
jgi:hypothetical protein